MAMEQNPTREEYTGLQAAFDFFNQKLFDGRLPQVLITLNRKSKAYGYFSPDRFGNRADDKASLDEIALNPDGFIGREDRDILSTLTHEMTHLEQQHFGKPPKKAYHDKKWGDLMKRVGLYPSNTGAPGGKETGSKMTHYIVEYGPYAKAFEELAESGFKLQWQSVPPPPPESKPKSKVKYSCSCGLNAWAKPGVKLVCEGCDEPLKSEEDDAEN